MKRSLAIVVLLASLFSGARAARADCAVGSIQTLTPNDAGVLVCVTYYTTPTSMLRQDTETGAVVELAPCAPVNQEGAQDACCFQDSCVQPGTYRYGLSTPLACASCGGAPTPYWLSTLVKTSYDGGCGNSAPTPYDGGVPWPSNGQPNEPCSGCGGCSTSASVLGVDSVLFAVALALVRRRRMRA